MRLQDYPNGTIIKIGDRHFKKVEPTTFWREIHDVPGNCVSRPSVSLERMEDDHGSKHVVVRQGEDAPATEQKTNIRNPAKLSPKESDMLVKMAVRANANSVNSGLSTLHMTPAEKRTGNALVKKGFAKDVMGAFFQINDAGRERAKQIY